MEQLPIGTHKSEFDTPILCIDLDVMEDNTARMAKFIIEENGKSWRPHQKCHKTPTIAWKLIRAGAMGATCAKVSEAEVMAQGGVTDLLIANMIIGERKLERIASLCRMADPIVACDHFAQAEALSDVCNRRGVECRVIAEVNIGLDRVGVRPGPDTMALVQAMDKLPGLKLAGIMGYEGHLLRIEDKPEKRTKIDNAMGVLGQCRDQMLAAGLCCDIVSAGGTGTYQFTSTCPEVTELQSGGGIFGDPMYRNHMGVEGHGYALTVLATVASRPTLDRAILDSGRKTVNPDAHMPILKGYPDAEVTALSAEHCAVKLGPESQDLKIGDKVELVVGYADFTTVLHDHFYAFRNEQLESIWPIAGRGKLQ